MSLHSVLLLAKPTIPQREHSICRFAGEHGWILRIEPIAMPPKDWRGDGVLVMLDGSAKAMRFVKQQLQRKIPVVGLNEDYSQIRIPRVSGDDHEIGQLAARHFNTRNFQHAAFFSALNDPNSHPARFAGFLNAWQGIFPQTWLWTNEAPEKNREDWHKLHAWLVAKLRKAPKPLAVFAWNDSDAVHVLNACLQTGISVPDEVAILGVDNNTVLCEQQKIKLSSVAHNLRRIGYVGAAMLERLMSGGTLEQSIMRIRPQGVVTRASTHTLVVDNDKFSAVLPYIDEHLSLAFGAAEVAAGLNLSRRALDRYFKSKFGHSVGVEISTRRIMKAKDLLNTTALPIEAIAEQCGYCNRQFFSKKFRQATGTTPLAWRKQRQRQTSQPER